MAADAENGYRGKKERNTMKKRIVLLLVLCLLAFLMIGCRQEETS